MREPSQLFRYICDTQSHLLGDQDERDAADLGAQEAPLPAPGAQRGEQTLGLVKTDRRHRNAGARRKFADRDQVGSVHGLLLDTTNAS